MALGARPSKLNLNHNIHGQVLSVGGTAVQVCYTIAAIEGLSENTTHDSYSDPYIVQCEFTCVGLLTPL